MIAAVFRRVIPVIVLGALLLVPASSFGAGATANLSGVITRVSGGVKVSLTNNGPDRTTYVWVRMPASVQHTGAMGDMGGGCGPGGDANTVKCGWGFPTYFPAGETRNVTIMTNAPYPNNGGAQLFTAFLPTDPMVPAGTATGPAALPSSPPPPPTEKPPKKCACKYLDLELDPTLLNKKLRPDKHDFGVGITWQMACTKGVGGCQGKLKFQPPKVLVGSIPEQSGALKLNLKSTTLTCKANCGKTASGRFEIKMLSRDQLNKLFGRTLAYTVVAECNKKSIREQVRVFIDDTGRLKQAP